MPKDLVHPRCRAPSPHTPVFLPRVPDAFFLSCAVPMYPWSACKHTAPFSQHMWSDQKKSQSEDTQGKDDVINSTAAVLSRWLGAGLCYSKTWELDVRAG